MKKMEPKKGGYKKYASDKDIKQGHSKTKLNVKDQRANSQKQMKPSQWSKAGGKGC